MSTLRDVLGVLMFFGPMVLLLRSAFLSLFGPETFSTAPLVPYLTSMSLGATMLGLLQIPAKHGRPLSPSLYQAFVSKGKSAADDLVANLLFLNASRSPWWVERVDVFAFTGHLTARATGPARIEKDGWVRLPLVLASYSGTYIAPDGKRMWTNTTLQPSSVLESLAHVEVVLVGTSGEKILRRALVLTPAVSWGDGPSEVMVAIHLERSRGQTRLALRSETDGPSEVNLGYPDDPVTVELGDINPEALIREWSQRFEEKDLPVDA